MPSPITFSCVEELPIRPADICAQIARVEAWPEFRGYGPIPGIASAEYERRTDSMIGSRIRVRNEDGSSHVETITAWNPDHGVAMEMGEFSAPLDRLALRFVETWDFTPVGGGTRVRRAFSLHPRSAMTRVPLWVISLLLRRAIARHLRQMKVAAR
jgi:hypothetical protein